jgi:sec-independent protein translocase protein TatC
MTRPDDRDEAEIEASKAPLLEHLIELRKRLIYSLMALFAGFVVCFAFANPIYNFLTAPLAHALAHEPGRHLIFTQVYEKFFTNAKVGLFAGLCLAFPVIAAQVWMFVAPGLYRHERRAFLPFLLASPVLFIAGASFVYYIMLPNALSFFLGFESKGSKDALPIEMMARVSEYFDFVTTLIFAFGLTFQLPVALALLGRVGIVSSDMLRSSRRYAVVGITILAAIFTPPDIFSMLSLMVPLVILYEISIWIVKAIERKRDKEAAERDAEAEE